MTTDHLGNLVQELQAITGDTTQGLPENVFFMPARLPHWS